MGTYKIIGPLHPIYDKSIIVHRDEFDEILTLLRHGEYIILNAPRQTGKTTLLFQVQEALRDEGMTAVYINLEGRDSEGFYQDLCKDIARQVDDVIESDETYSIKDIQNQIDFRKYLEWIAAYTPKVQRLVFLLDEVGGVPDEVHDPFFLGFRAARINIQMSRWSFVFTGAIDIMKLDETISSPLTNVCWRLTLDDFSEMQTGELLKQLPNLTEDAQAALIKSVYEWTGGQPYLTQKICMLIEQSNEYQSGTIDDAKGFLEKLVWREILENWNTDSNLSHLFRHFSDGKQCSFLLDILNGKKKRFASRTGVELEMIGFIKRSSKERTYVIRNHIYEEALRFYFEDEPIQTFKLSDEEKAVLHKIQEQGISSYIDIAFKSGMQSEIVKQLIPKLAENGLISKVDSASQKYRGMLMEFYELTDDGRKRLNA